MRDRPVETRLARNVGIGVDRHVVAACLPVEQRGLRRCREVTNLGRLAEGLHSLGQIFSGTPNPPQPPSSRRNSVDLRFARSSPVASSNRSCAVWTTAPRPGPLSSTARIRCSARTAPSAGRGRTKREALLAVQNAPPDDPGLRHPVPERWPAEGHALAWHSKRPSTLVDVGEFVLVERILAHAETERVERAVAEVVTLEDRRESQVADVVRFMGSVRRSGTEGIPGLRWRQDRPCGNRRALTVSPRPKAPLGLTQSNSSHSSARSGR